MHVIDKRSLEHLYGGKINKLPNILAFAKKNTKFTDFIYKYSKRAGQNDVDYVKI